MRTRGMTPQIFSTNPIVSNAEFELLRDVELEKLNEFWDTQDKHSSAQKTRHQHHQDTNWQGEQANWLGCDMTNKSSEAARSGSCKY